MNRAFLSDSDLKFLFDKINSSPKDNFSINKIKNVQQRTENPGAKVDADFSSTLISIHSLL